MALHMTHAYQVRHLGVLLFMQPAAQTRHKHIGRRTPEIMQHMVAEFKIVGGVADRTMHARADLGQIRAIRPDLAYLLAQGTLHGESALRLCVAGPRVRDVGIPVRDFTAAARIDAESVQSVFTHVKGDHTAHVVDPSRPVEIKAPVVERRAVFVLRQPLRMLFGARILIATAVWYAILPDAHPKRTGTRRERLEVIGCANPLLQLVVVTRPVNRFILKRHQPDRIAAQAVDMRQQGSGSRKAAEIAAVRADRATRMKRIENHALEPLRSPLRRHLTDCGEPLGQTPQRRLCIVRLHPEPRVAHPLRHAVAYMPLHVERLRDTDLAASLLHACTAAVGIGL